MLACPPLVKSYNIMILFALRQVGLGLIVYSMLFLMAAAAFALVTAIAGLLGAP